ncbi:hypothetical protein [uncultured Maribacter sp.]|uniref:hypothetical protein n=1 Tax=uncultured Maribacter sp. TaxID=431308 RepID=UPI00262F5E8A|nr:hypothetical protein [uncultured Maribacter sp.]
MKKLLYVFASVAFLTSCVPIRIAPSISDYNVTKGKKFKRSLSKRQMFIFEDPKEANDFYNYVNTKYDLQHIDVYDNVPFKINEEQYFFSFYEVKIPDKAINFFPFVTSVLFNAAIGNFEDAEIEDPTMDRKDNWYLAIEVYSDLEKDCLEINSLSREVVLKYLRTLKKEYLSTHNYNEIVFKN